MIQDVQQGFWFAWYPVKTENKGWVWLDTVLKTMDFTFVQYESTPRIRYYSLK